MIRSAVAPFRLGALGIATILVLGGCSGPSGEPNAEAAENSSSSPSSSESTSPMESAAPSATPTATYKPATAEGPAENVPPPVMPELANEESKEGLEAFAKYWYATIDYGFETGDLEPFKAINGPDCIVCKSVFDIVGPGYRNEDWITGGKLEVIGTKTTYSPTSKQQYQILVQLRQDPYEYRGPGGHLYEENGGLDSTTVHLIEASYLDHHWFAHNVVAI
ncbi:MULTISPECIES: DUF6318 family protein [unclassified Arthrobacter]|uniref:DUF6318 family protein n=1 Tax=unclassified Arthrobacter TaxID=235627 RepID=UPI0011B096D3|nr:MULTISPECIES: DUF6318 family protein [unclassified Arthrobacter]